MRRCASAHFSKKARADTADQVQRMTPVLKVWTHNIEQNIIQTHLYSLILYFVHEQASTSLQFAFQLVEKWEQPQQAQKEAFNSSENIVTFHFWAKIKNKPKMFEWCGLVKTIRESVVYMSPLPLKSHSSTCNIQKIVVFIRSDSCNVNTRWIPKLICLLDGQRHSFNGKENVQGADQKYHRTWLEAQAPLTGTNSCKLWPLGMVAVQ